MCYAVYLGSKYKQQTSGFVSGETYLFLADIDAEEEEGLRPKFTKQNIYYAGSFEKCSCGFGYWPEDDEGYDEQDKIARLTSIGALLSLLGALTREEDVEFYCCWMGDWPNPVKEYLQIDIRQSDCRNKLFWLTRK